MKKKEITRTEIINTINKLLETKNWSSNERIFGKKIDVPAHWEEIMHSAIHEYREAKWSVFWFEEGNKSYLLFDFPKPKKTVYSTKR